MSSDQINFTKSKFPLTNQFLEDPDLRLQSGMLKFEPAVVTSVDRIPLQESIGFSQLANLIEQFPISRSNSVETQPPTVIETEDLRSPSVSNTKQTLPDPASVQYHLSALLSMLSGSHVSVQNTRDVVKLEERMVRLESSLQTIESKLDVLIRHKSQRRAHRAASIEGKENSPKETVSRHSKPSTQKSSRTHRVRLPTPPEVTPSPQVVHQPSVAVSTPAVAIHLATPPLLSPADRKARSPSVSVNISELADRQKAFEQRYEQLLARYQTQ